MTNVHPASCIQLRGWKRSIVRLRSRQMLARGLSYLATHRCLTGRIAAETVWPRGPMRARWRR